MGDRLVFVLPDDAGDDDVAAARAAGADEVIRRSDLSSWRTSDAPGAENPPAGAPDETFLDSLTPTERRVITELAHRPDTRSRLAARLGTTTSTLDNHLSALKRKLLAHLESAGQGPSDGYLSMEAVIGWANRHIRE